MINKEIKKLEDEKRKYQKYCEFCGHTMSFYSFEKDKKLCNHCGLSLITHLTLPTTPYV